MKLLKLIQISIAPYGRNFRGAGHVWTTCPGLLLGNLGCLFPTKHAHRIFTGRMRFLTPSNWNMGVAFSVSNAEGKGRHSLLPGFPTPVTSSMQNKRTVGFTCETWRVALKFHLIFYFNSKSVHFNASAHYKLGQKVVCYFTRY